MRYRVTIEGECEFADLSAEVIAAVAPGLGGHEALELYVRNALAMMPGVSWDRLGLLVGAVGS